MSRADSEVCTGLETQQPWMLPDLNQGRLPGWGWGEDAPLDLYIKGESLPRGVKLKNFLKNAKSEYLKYLNSISTDLRLFTLRKG